jgi:hypothetical protein
VFVLTKKTNLVNSWFYYRSERGTITDDNGHIKPATSRATNRGKRRGEAANAGLRTLPQEISKQTLDDWKHSAAEYVRSEMFAKKQFVRDEQLELGGTIQILVCSYINICVDERVRLIWNEKGGKEMVRNTFRRKQQAAQNSMTLAFKGKGIIGD